METTGILIFDANGGSDAPTQIELPVGTKVNLLGYTATPPDDKKFDGWSLDSNGGEIINSIELEEGEITVYAIYAEGLQPAEVSIEFYEADGETPFKSMSGTNGGTITAPEAPEGMAFVGWKDDKNGTVYTVAGVNARIIDGDLKYIAYFKNADTPVTTTKTLIFDADEGKDAPAAMTLPTGTKVQLIGLVATAPTGREFNGWKLNDSLVTEVTLNNNIILVADYTLVNPAGPFTVTFSAGANGIMIPGSAEETVTGGNTITIPVPRIIANSSYTFEGWTLNGGGTKYSSEDVAKMKITGDSDFVAYYSKTTITGGGGGNPATTQYTLTYETNGGSKIAAVKYAEGTTVNLTAVPTKEGFAFTGWYSDKELTNKITSIKMDGNKTVYAGWEKGGHSTEPVDVSGGNVTPSAFNSTEHVKYVSGYEDGTIRPNANITRAEVASMIYRLLTEVRRNEIYTTTNNFTDVDESKWYNIAVSSMANGNYIAGYPDGSFGGEKNITRAEFVTMLVNFLDAPIESGTTFADVPETHWAAKNIKTAVAAGWISSYEDGTFKPGKALTRAEAISVLNRVLNRNPESREVMAENLDEFKDNVAGAWYYLNILEATNEHHYVRNENGTEKWVD